MTFLIKPKKAMRNSGLLSFAVTASIKIKDLPQTLKFEITKEYSLSDENIYLNLIAQGGREFWIEFKKSKHFKNLDPKLHKLDCFTTELILKFDEKAVVLFPTNPNFKIGSFGKFLFNTKTSYLKIEFHKYFGPWFAYRGAFLSALPITTPLNQKNRQLLKFSSPCLTCRNKPCLIPNALDTRLNCPFNHQMSYSLEQIQYHKLALENY